MERSGELKVEKKSMIANTRSSFIAIAAMATNISESKAIP